MTTPGQDIRQFTGKYESRNPASRWLVKNFFASLKKILPTEAVNSVLEVGCGAGFSTQIISALLPHAAISASDVSQELVDQARRLNPQARFQTESVYSLQRPDASFDLVLCLEVLEHLDRPDDALKEMRRVAKRFCLMSVPHEPLWRICNMLRLAHLIRFGNTPGHIQHWSGEKFARYCGRYFKIIDIKSPIPWTMVLGEKNI